MNYFHYFSEIEDRFAQRRGSLLMLSTLDWALIETWREAGVPLEAVLRGIDAAFDKHDAKKHTARTRKVNGLAWCAQAVMQATEELHEAATGIHKPDATPQDTGLEAERVAAFLSTNADRILAAALPSTANDTALHTAQRLRELALTMRSETPLALDDLDRTLTVLEERLIAALTNAAPEAEIVALRTEADRDLAPFRAKLQHAQLKQIQTQYLLKKLFAAYDLPRLSLFYMDVAA